MSSTQNKGRFSKDHDEARSYIVDSVFVSTFFYNSSREIFILSNYKTPKFLVVLFC
jgi:hypothetical protein